MKRLICLMISLCMILSLAGCASGQQPQGGQDTPQTGKSGAEDPAKQEDDGPKTGGKESEEPSDPGQVDTAGYNLVSPEIAECAQYPKEEDFEDGKGGIDWDAWSEAQDAWYEEYGKRSSAGTSVGGTIAPYFEDMIPALYEACEEPNFTASPSNIYIALAMLAELTEGESRAQILRALHIDSIEAARQSASLLWYANHTDDGVVKSLPAASVWVNSKADVKRAVLADLAEYYYASVWQGDPEDKNFSRAFKEWLDEQTGGLLKDRIESLEDFKKEMIVTLATTIYYKAPWRDEFPEFRTEKDIFHAEETDVTVDFMNCGSRDYVFRGSGFTAVRKTLVGNGTMWFILPDEGKDPGDILTNGAVTDFFMKRIVSPESSYDGLQEYQIELSVPKFDVAATIDLSKVMEALGIVDVFYSDKADFSPLTDSEACVSSATHSARVKIDEQGVEAAAFTVIMVDEMAFMDPPPVYEFKCDRPFVFAIEGQDGLPLFIGTVEQPE